MEHACQSLPFPSLAYVLLSFALWSDEGQSLNVITKQTRHLEIAFVRVHHDHIYPLFIHVTPTPLHLFYLRNPLWVILSARFQWVLAGKGHNDGVMGSGGMLVFILSLLVWLLFGSGFYFRSRFLLGSGFLFGSGFLLGSGILLGSGFLFGGSLLLFRSSLLLLRSNFLLLGGGFLLFWSSLLLLGSHFLWLRS